jgi:hypothetical protein
MVTWTDFVCSYFLKELGYVLRIFIENCCYRLLHGRFILKFALHNFALCLKKINRDRKFSWLFRLANKAYIFHCYRAPPSLSSNQKTPLRFWIAFSLSPASCNQEPTSSFSPLCWVQPSVRRWIYIFFCLLVRLWTRDDCNINQYNISFKIILYVLIILFVKII